MKTNRILSIVVKLTALVFCCGLSFILGLCFREQPLRFWSCNDLSNEFVSGCSLSSADICSQERIICHLVFSRWLYELNVLVENAREHAKLPCKDEFEIPQFALYCGLPPSSDNAEGHFAAGEYYFEYYPEWNFEDSSDIDFSPFQAFMHYIGFFYEKFPDERKLKIDEEAIEYSVKMSLRDTIKNLPKSLRLAIQKQQCDVSK